MCLAEIREWGGGRGGGGGGGGGGGRGGWGVNDILYIIIIMVTCILMDWDILPPIVGQLHWRIINPSYYEIDIILIIN